MADDCETTTTQQVQPANEGISQEASQSDTLNPHSCRATQPRHSASVDSGPINCELSELLLSNSIGFDEREKLRRRLRYYFMNPFQKWRAKRKFPIKMLLQVLKIIFVTLQFVVLGNEMNRFFANQSSMLTSFRNLFLNHWDSTREVISYPPANGPFAIYTKEGLYSSIDYAVINIAHAVNNSFAHIGFVDSPDRPDSIEFRITELVNSSACPWNFTYRYSGHVHQRLINFTVQGGNWHNFSSFKFLSERNETIDFATFVDAKISTKLHAIYVNTLDPVELTECYEITINIKYDNSQQDGQVSVSLDSDFAKRQCNGEATSGKSIHKLPIALSYIVMCLSLISALLCLRSVYRGMRLKSKAVKFFRQHYGKEISTSDKMDFIDFWLFIIYFTDMSLIYGSFCKLVQFINNDLQRNISTSLSLGISILLVYISFLRYFSFFRRYNMLILTLKKSLPEVIRFTLCVFILFMGYSFAGWIVLGPYHVKFRTIGTTCECLLSLLNGDDMFATFATLSDPGDLRLWLFSRVYLWTFICLFVYVILSLLVSIIMDTWYSIKNGSTEEKSDLHKFIEECNVDDVINHMHEDEGTIFSPCINNLCDMIFRPFLYHSQSR